MESPKKTAMKTDIRRDYMLRLIPLLCLWAIGEHRANAQIDEGSFGYRIPSRTSGTSLGIGRFSAFHISKSGGTKVLCERLTLPKTVLNKYADTDTVWGPDMTVVIGALSDPGSPSLQPSKDATRDLYTATACYQYLTADPPRNAALREALEQSELTGDLYRPALVWDTEADAPTGLRLTEVIGDRALYDQWVLFETYRPPRPSPQTTDAAAAQNGWTHGYTAQIELIPIPVDEAVAWLQDLEASPSDLCGDDGRGCRYASLPLRFRKAAVN